MFWISQNTTWIFLKITTDFTLKIPSGITSYIISDIFSIKPFFSGDYLIGYPRTSSKTPILNILEYQKLLHGFIRTSYKIVPQNFFRILARNFFKFTFRNNSRDRSWNFFGNSSPNSERFLKEVFKDLSKHSFRSFP